MFVTIPIPHHSTTPSLHYSIIDSYEFTIISGRCGERRAGDFEDVVGIAHAIAVVAGIVY